MYKSILLVAVQYKLKHLTREKIGIKNKPKKITLHGLLLIQCFFNLNKNLYV